MVECIISMSMFVSSGITATKKGYVDEDEALNKNEPKTNSGATAMIAQSLE